MQRNNMIMIYYWDKKLKKKNDFHVLEADIITYLISLAQRMYLLRDVFPMTVLYFDLLTQPKMPFQGDAPEVMRGNRVGGNSLMKWVELKKSPWYTHRLMRRKRVTCELHDSYFRLMTIKHSIVSLWYGTWQYNNCYCTRLSNKSLLYIYRLHLLWDTHNDGIFRSLFLHT